MKCERVHIIDPPPAADYVLENDEGGRERVCAQHAAELVGAGAHVRVVPIEAVDGNEGK